MPAHAAPGDLDPSFNSDGKVLTPVGTRRFDEANGVVVQPDGKIIVAGTADAMFVPLSFALVRYNRDGSLDAGFGSGGRVSTFFGDASANATGIALQPDGKIVVVGGAGGDFALARYNLDGSPDASFGAGGQVITDLGSSSSDEARAVAIQPDGAIVVVGASGSHAVVVRYTLSGKLDAGFGSGGVVTVDLPGLQTSVGTDLALQSDGRIVVIGQTLTAVARLKSDGNFDRSFGTHGKVSPSSLPTSDNHAAAIALQSDGKIVADSAVLVGGTTESDLALARYDADGNLDVGFGTGGLVTTDFGVGKFDLAHDLVVQADGKIVAAGVADLSRDLFPTSSFALARYTPEGSLDDSFGSGGKATTLFDKHDEAHALALQPDGRIVAAGFGAR